MHQVQYFKIFFKMILVLIILCLSFTQSSYADEQTAVRPPFLSVGFYLNSFPDILLKDIKVALLFWAEELVKQENIPAKIKIYKNLDNMRTDFYQGRVNFISANPLIFINDFTLDEFSQGITTAMHGSATDKLIFITHKLSSLDRFSDFKGKHLSLLINEPVSEMFANVLALEYFGKEAKQVFSRITYSYKSSPLIYNLFFKKTDVILIYLQDYKLAIELNPQIGKQTQVIAELEKIPRGMGLFNRRIDPVFSERVIKRAERLHKSPRGQQFLALFQAEHMVRVDLDDLNAVQRLKQRYLKLVKKHE